MKIITTILFFTSVSLAMFVSSQHMYGSACDVERSSQVQFSSSTTPDTMIVQVIGGSCEDAVLNIEIQNPDKVPLYTYSGNFSSHLPFDIDNDDLASAAIPFVESILDDANSRNTQTLPDLSSPQQYFKQNREVLMVSPNVYTALQQTSDQPIVRHSTQDGTWLNLVYNADNKTATPILWGGANLDSAPKS